MLQQTTDVRGVVFRSYSILLGSILIAPEAWARTYCIQGNSTGVGWSWAIDGRIEKPGVERPFIILELSFSGTVGNGEVKSGAGPGALVDRFVASLNAHMAPHARARRISANCFRVTGFAISGLDTMVLRVGPINDPRACLVHGRNRCSFNPTISEVSSSAVPSTTQWGLIALGLLLAGSLAFMIQRRIRMRPAGA